MKYGGEGEVKMTEVVVPVVEVPTTEPLKQMIGSGLIAASVEGIPVQNGLTTLNVSLFLRIKLKMIYMRTVRKFQLQICTF